MKRQYVIICNRHKGLAGALLFWGVHTEDNAERSFGGYTSDINGCEIYDASEIQKEVSGEKLYPIYGVDFKTDIWRKQQDFAIKITQLPELGCRPLTIWYS